MGIRQAVHGARWCKRLAKVLGVAVSELAGGETVSVAGNRHRSFARISPKPSALPPIRNSYSQKTFANRFTIGAPWHGLGRIPIGQSVGQLRPSA